VSEGIQVWNGAVRIQGACFTESAMDRAIASDRGREIRRGHDSNLVIAPLLN
jgi:hypothetical protein